MGMRARDVNAFPRNPDLRTYVQLRRGKPGGGRIGEPRHIGMNMGLSDRKIGGFRARFYAKCPHNADLHRRLRPTTFVNRGA
jgi:hypothetical protein